MSNDSSVTQWLEQLKTGDSDEAQRELWNRYFMRLVGLARKQLGDLPRRVADEEDAALSVLNSFFGGVQEGAFPDLKDRTNLWPLLAKITVRKAINQRKRACAQKRWAGQRGHSVFLDSADEQSPQGFDQVPDGEPTPEFVALLREETNLLLDSLNDEMLRSVAVQKMKGFSNGEIASQLGVVERTIERKLERIRTIWSRSEPPRT